MPELTTGAIILMVLYFLPAVIAMTRGHTSAGGIFIINLFLGWTLLGWVCALAWAASSFRPRWAR
jgi:hypothetical protein